MGWCEHQVFNDSLQLFGSSLETLASNLHSSWKEPIRQLGASFQVQWAAHPDVEMLVGKGVASSATHRRKGNSRPCQPEMP